MSQRHGVIRGFVKDSNVYTNYPIIKTQLKNS